MASTFSRWIPVEFPFLDTTIKLKLRAFNKREAPAFKASVQSRFSDLEKRDGETESAHESRVGALLSNWLDLTRDAFARYVRVVEPIADADDPAVVIADGPSLYAEAPGDFAMKVMLKLAELASLGDTEGNSSGSPSTSAVVASPNTSDAPATTIDESATSPSHSTATGPNEADASSTQAA